MKHILFLFILLLSALCATAQNNGCTITGVVREYDLGLHKQALDGVSVRISVNGNRTDVTKDGGKFTIKNVPYCTPGTKIQTDINSFIKQGYELFYPDVLDFWRVPNSTSTDLTEILMCKSSRINEVRQKLFNVVDQHQKKLYEQKKAELAHANLENRKKKRQLIILESQLRDTAQIMRMVDEWLYLDRVKCDSVLNLAYSYFENGDVDMARDIMNNYEMQFSNYYNKKKNEVDDELVQALQFVKRRIMMNFSSDDENVIPFIERDCDFLIDIYTDKLNKVADDMEGIRGDEKHLKEQLAAAYALKGDIAKLVVNEDDLPEIIANYRKAAELGNAHAQYKMGEIYENSLSSDNRAKSFFNTQYLVNLDSARYWYSKAANQNYIEAIRTLENFYDFIVKDKNGNELYYHILPDHKSVSVVHVPYNACKEYAGNIVLPSEVIYNSINYVVTKIDDYAFIGCDRLQSVTIPNSVKTIGESAFDLCYNLESVDLGKSVTSIGESAFFGCNLKSVVIGNSVRTIGDYAFASCFDLKSVIIGNSVTKMGDRVFLGTSVSSFKCKKGGVCMTTKDGAMLLKKTDQGHRLVAFASDCSIRDVTIPNSVISIEEGVFRNNSIHQFKCEKGGACITTEDGAMILEKTNQGYRLVAFASDCAIRNVIIPNTVTSVGDYAFYRCDSLQSVTIPNTVTSIGNSAFSECKNLKSITIGDSVKTVGKWAFTRCENLQSVLVPNLVTNIEDYVFSECKNLQSVTIPNSVTNIGDYAFSECENLESVTIPNSVTSIGNYAFSKCENLQGVTIPNSVTNIGDEAFSECKNLQSVTIPNSVTNIGKFAFRACSRLESVIIGDSVVKIKEGTFRACRNLKSVVIGDSVKIDKNAFFACPFFYSKDSSDNED